MGLFYWPSYGAWERSSQPDLRSFCLDKEKQGLYFCAEDHLQYVEMANRLIRDPVLRERVGMLENDLLS